MRIGILTLHYGYNEGAILQSMALSCLLKETLTDVEVSIIDQRYPKKSVIYGPPDDARKKALQSAIDHWLPLSRTRFRDDDHKKVFKFCQEHFDAIVVGSDVVWSLKYTGRFRRLLGNGILPRQIEPFHPAFPNVYWPDASANQNRFAYAASCGNLRPADIPRSHRRQMASILDGFKAISVRDKRTLDLVCSLSTNLTSRSCVVPDPTLAFNLLEKFNGASAEEKLQYATKRGKEKTVLVIMKESPLSLAVVDALKRRGFSVVTTGHFQGLPTSDLLPLGLTPMEWAWMPRKFHFCITERMHATIFCVLNRTPILALDMNTRHQDSRTKLEELMVNLGFGVSCFHQADLEESRIENILKQFLSTSFDWSKAESTLIEWRDDARVFIRNLSTTVAYVFLSTAMNAF
jgi:hypothetical protein